MEEYENLLLSACKLILAKRQRFGLILCRKKYLLNRYKSKKEKNHGETNAKKRTFCRKKFIFVKFSPLL